jgi:hypothetical protein
MSQLELLALLSKVDKAKHLPVPRAAIFRVWEAIKRFKGLEPR